jgi:hypothetical protein
MCSSETGLQYKYISGGCGLVSSPEAIASGSVKRQCLSLSDRRHASGGMDFGHTCVGPGFVWLTEELTGTAESLPC